MNDHQLQAAFEGLNPDQREYIQRANDNIFRYAQALGTERARVFELDARIKHLEGLLRYVEDSGSCGRYGNEVGCPFCFAEKSVESRILHENDCQAFTLGGELK